MTAPVDPDADRWVDLPSAVALTGIRRYDRVLAITITGGQVRWTTHLPGHERTLMITLPDVQHLAGVLQSSGSLHAPTEGRG